MTDSSHTSGGTAGVPGAKSRRWINWLSRRSGFVLCLSGLLSLLSLWVFAQYGSLNSDLNRLIDPPASLTWFQDNEAYKAAFPQFQQTAVLVVRGNNYQQVQDYTRRVAQRLPLEFVSDVFAPGVDEFISSKKPFFLDLDQLDRWLDGASYNQGSLLRLLDEASVANMLFTYADFISANPGQVLPISLQSIVDSLPAAQLDFQGYYPLQPDDEEFIELIIGTGLQQLSAALPNAAIVEALQATLAEFPPPAGVRVALTGEVALAHEEIGAALGGVELAGILSLVLLAVILHVGIRSGRIVMAIALMLAMGISMTLGFATLTVGSLNTLSMIFIVLFFGLGVDFAAHFTLRAQATLAKHSAADLAEQSNASMAVALSQALHDTGPALALCTLTSAASFLAFLPTAYRGFAELGIISAGGIVIALLLTLTVIPAVLLRWPAMVHGAESGLGGHWSLTPLFVRFRQSLNQLPSKGVVAGFAALTLAALWSAKDLRFDYSVLAMRDAQAPAMQALLELQQDQQTTDYSVHLLAADAQAAAELKLQLLQLPTVGAVTTPADFVPANQGTKANALVKQLTLLDELQPPPTSEHDAEHTKLALEYLREVADSLQGSTRQQAEAVFVAAQRLVQDQAATAIFEQQLAQQMPQALAEFRALLAAQPFGLENVPSQFQQRLITADGQHLLSVNPVRALNDRDATDAFIAEVVSVAPNAAGRSVVEWGIGEVVVESFQQATTTAFAVIFVLLLLYFRGWKLPLLVLMPIAMTVVLTFALCVLLGISLNMANILMVPLILGLGVDTGIHIVHRHRQDQGHQPANGDRQTVDAAVRRAVMISGLTTIGTFCSLSLSPHQGTASIGLLLTIAIGLLLLISLLLLPILLGWFAPKNSA